MSTTLEAMPPKPLDIDAAYPEHGEAEGVAAPHQADGNGARVLLHFATHDVIRQSRSGRAFRLPMEGADLSLLNSGRAPLLADHERHIDAILGVVEMAWVDQEMGCAFAVARFAPTRRGLEAQAMVAAGVLNNCSMGLAMSAEPEHLDEGVIVSPWWRPFEVTLCALPGNWHAHVKVVPPKSLDRLAAEESARKAKALRDAIAADRLQEAQGLARAVAPGLAERLGVDPEAARAALAEAMGAHLGG